MHETPLTPAGENASGTTPPETPPTLPDRRAMNDAAVNDAVGNTAENDVAADNTMANKIPPPETPQDQTRLPETPLAQARSLHESLAPIVLLAAWIVPGLGHFFLRRWSRGLAFFLAVGGLAIAGYGMRGDVFTAHSVDTFGTLGFLADAGSGIFYFLAHSMERAGPDVSRAAGDYGTRFIAAAGIVNVLGMLDAYGITFGRRS